MKIRCLNLDSMFVPIPRPEIKYEMFQFNGGKEWHITLNNLTNYDEINEVIITHRIKSGDDIMQILFAKDALERKGIKNFTLFIPYLPYARQDRVCNEGESFTLKVFANLINSANFNKVMIYDPHSDVGPALINNSHIIKNDEFIKWILAKQIKSSEINVVSPDAGASKRIHQLINRSERVQNIIQCDKIRNLKTGKLSGFKVFADKIDLPCLIIDDICDGGRTFIGIAEKLKKKGAPIIYLAVSHGLFSKGYRDLLNIFDEIYTTNSFQDILTATHINQYKIQI